MISLSMEHTFLNISGDPHTEYNFRRKDRKTLIEHVVDSIGKTARDNFFIISKRLPSIKNAPQYVPTRFRYSCNVLEWFTDKKVFSVMFDTLCSDPLVQKYIKDRNVSNLRKTTFIEKQKFLYDHMNNPIHVAQFYAL